MSEDAIRVEFDNATNGFVSDDVQTAIEEIKQYIVSKGRFSVTAGFDGNASTGRWLEFITNTASGPSGSGVGFVVPKKLYQETPR
jgi:hypothetical protein